MTLVNIDRQPEAVKQFFAALALDPEGSFVEMNGRRVAHLLPAEDWNTGQAEPEWSPQVNQRRCELIDRKFTARLVPSEESELVRLTIGLRRFVDRVAPVPLDEVRRLHQTLLECASDAKS